MEKGGWPTPTKAMKRQDSIEKSKGTPKETGGQPGPFTGPLHQSNVWNPEKENRGEEKGRKIS